MKVSRSPAMFTPPRRYRWPHLLLVVAVGAVLSLAAQLATCEPGGPGLATVTTADTTAVAAPLDSLARANADLAADARQLAAERDALARQLGRTAPSSPSIPSIFSPDRYASRSDSSLDSLATRLFVDQLRQRTGR